MRRQLACLLLFLLLPSFAFSSSPAVRPGIEVLRDRGFDILKGKRIGLITNPTGVTSDLESTIDVLFNAPGVKLVALYGPEHGVRGDADAGKTIDAYTDSRTNLPVYSLYGKTRKPSKEMLKEIDILVYDIQDIGVRSYTYISTMGLAMEAAAENNIPFVVLDRPNPLTGNRVEGPMLEPQFKSFIGAYQIPYVYGMTAGELAQMINGEGWMGTPGKCALTVVPMKGWKRSMWWDQTGLPWVPTSPHIPQWQHTMFYVLTGLLGELGTANQGVGYTLPFELVGAPWVDQNALARYLNNLKLQGVIFRPMTYTPFYRDTTGIQYRGVQVHIVDRQAMNMTHIQMHIIDALMKLFPNYNIFTRARSGSLNSFDKAVGNAEVRRQFMARDAVEDILAQCERTSAQFAVKRSPYLIYE
jgi:uncharacterized protein YbbC (DUF1343 family)